MYKAVLLSFGGIFFSVGTFLLLYFLCLFFPSLALLLLAGSAWIYLVSSVIFSGFHGYFCACKQVKYPGFCALINGVILMLPTFFFERVLSSMIVGETFIISLLTLVFCPCISLLLYYTSESKAEYKRILSEDRKNENITDADDDDDARLQYLISELSKNNEKPKNE